MRDDLRSVRRTLAGGFRRSRLATGELFLIAADGDVLFAVFTGTISKSEFGDLGFADLTVTFMGGTGRFSDATGSAELLFAYDSFTGESDSSFEGTIDY